MANSSNGFFSEFKKFALRGNVIDLAVGVIIGGAFGTITSSLVADIIMPFIGGIDFTALTVSIGPIFPGRDASVLNLGVFIQTVINFIILAFVVFMIVRGINRLREAEKRKEAPAAPPAPPAPPAPTKEELLLTEIRDILKEQSK